MSHNSKIEKAYTLMNIQVKDAETYFTPISHFTEDHKKIFEALSLHTKIMAGNRVRIYGGTKEDKEKALLELIKHYDIPEDKKSMTQPKQYLDPHQDIPKSAIAPKMQYKTYRCAGGCSCTSLGWNSPPPHIDK